MEEHLKSCNATIVEIMWGSVEGITRKSLFNWHLCNSIDKRIRSNGPLPLPIGQYSRQALFSNEWFLCLTDNNMIKKIICLPAGELCSEFIKWHTVPIAEIFIVWDHHATIFYFSQGTKTQPFKFVVLHHVKWKLVMIKKST